VGGRDAPERVTHGALGHTDMTGSMDANMKLSPARGEAVVQVLVSQHGVAASRLKGFGVGPLAPVATNATEEGRAKNRRVELVKE
jgi:OOP family OmpA-OmpF porin